MKTVFALGIFFVLAAGCGALGVQSYLVETEIKQLLAPLEQLRSENRTFLTRVDHFRPQDKRTARFTYYQNVHHYRPGGPIYFYVHDGTNFTTPWLETGLMHDIAVKQQAALITAPHRYYRGNYPTDSATFEELEFLTIEQSLADIATLINAVRMDLKSSSPVILWGTGYGAFLAVMARQKYPHLVQGVWSSSGIFRHETYPTDTYTHLESVIRNIGGEQCANILRSVFSELKEMIYEGQGEAVAEMLKLCAPVTLKSEKNVVYFFRGQFILLKDNINFNHRDGVLSLCQAIDSTDPIGAYGRWLKRVFITVDCFDLDYFSRMSAHRTVEWNTTGTNGCLRQWYYYKCTQTGLWEITTPALDIFPNISPSSYHSIKCRDILGEAYNPDLLDDRLAAVNLLYGGLNPGVTNVIYTNGELDIWFPMGIRNAEGNPGAEVINIPNYGKSADLRSISDVDSSDLRNAKQRIEEVITLWSTSDLRILIS